MNRNGKELEILMRMTNWDEDERIPCLEERILEKGGETIEERERQKDKKLDVFSHSVGRVLERVLDEVREWKDVLVKKWRERVECEIFESLKKFKELGGGVRVIDVMQKGTSWRFCFLNKNFAKWLKRKVLSNGEVNLSLRIEGMFKLGEVVRRKKDGVLMGEIFLQKGERKWYFLSPWEKLSLWVEFLLFLWFCETMNEKVIGKGKRKKIERGIYTANWFDIEEIKKELLKEALKHTVDVEDVLYFEDLRFFLSEIVKGIGDFIKWEVPERFSLEQVQEMVRSVGKDKIILDDFGDMHSGFKFYTEVGGDFLKIDIRQLIGSIEDTEGILAVKRVMFQFLKKFLLLIKGKLVIERVEREEELEEFLMKTREMGLPWSTIMEQIYFQGFLFTKGVGV